MHTAINTMMQRTNTTGAALSLSYGSDRNSVSSMLSRHNAPSLDRFLRMSDYMGYKVVLERGEDRIEVDPPKEQGMVDGDFTCRQMARLFDRLEDHYELSDACKTENAGIHAERWDRTERERMAGWFRANTGRGWGQYSRQSGNDSARRCYSRLQTSNGLLWIAEAMGIDAEKVREASRVALAEEDHRRRCGAIRRVIPWDMVYEHALPMIEEYGIR